MAQLALLGDERPRHILHVNTDDFFASLARLRDASLVGRPVVVGNLMNRGSVVSASYEARAAGVHPGLTMQQARQLVPDATLVQVDWAYAQRASQEIFRVLDGYAPQVERAGLDEAFVDYGGCERLLGPPLDAAARLRCELNERVRLDVSIGVATNKLVSRFASSAAKRHSLLDVMPGYEASFVAPYPVARLPGVGPTLGRKLHDMGVPTVGDLARFPPEVLAAVFGPAGRGLAEAARGIDRSPVSRARERQVLVETATLEPDGLDLAGLTGWLEVLCARLGATLRARGWAARRLAVRLEHSDRVRAERSVRLVPPTHLDPRLAAAAREALALAYLRRVRVRRLAVELAGFEPSPVQLDLFLPDGEARLRRLVHAADRIRARYPTGGALVPARALLAQAYPRTALLAPPGPDRPTGDQRTNGDR
jgi:DNA polymerase-4